jgi:hypothetical protein
MTQFDPPGFLDDLNDAQREQWSSWISTQIDEVTAGQPQVYDFDAPRPRFFNPLGTPPAADAVERDISWKAFPRIIELESSSDAERWETADGSRDVQDEYCEWSVTRDPANGKIARVTFTSEGPEYWQFLALVNMPRVVELYKKHVDIRVKAQDIVDSQGRYNPRNRWNRSTREGAMHLIQPNNTLGAEIELAAGASNVRRRNGQILTGARELIECGRYGAIERHSDPHIGSEVNSLARADAAITLANPVGLCIAGLATAGWQTPDGSDAQSYWSITRGTAQKALRAVYSVPADRGFTVSDIRINGQPIAFGAQIADFITIKLTGLATRLGQLQVPPLDGCKKLHSGGPGLGASVPTVAAAIAASPRASR